MFNCLQSPLILLLSVLKFIIFSIYICLEKYTFVIIYKYLSYSFLIDFSQWNKTLL